MQGLINLDLISVGISIAGILILGFAVFFSKTKSITHRTFVLFTIVAAGWGFFNYANYQSSSPIAVLWMLRLVLFFAVWYSFFFFQFFYVFPQDSIIFPKNYKFILLPIIALVSLTTLTPFVFPSLAYLAPVGEVSKTVVAPGIIFFAITVIGMIVSGIYSLISKIRRATGKEKTQFKFLLIGTIITFTLHIIFNLILPGFFLNVRFIPLGALFTFPLIAFTTYAILKHHLLNLKIIATEMLIFVLAVAALFDLLSSKDISAVILRFSIFLLILMFGILLDKSVRREIEQREQLETLTGQLADANEKLKALDQARAEFISIASHQLRTPPATVKWYLSALLSGDYGKVPPALVDKLKKTAQTNDHLISLIEDMLNVSRIERGKMEFLFALTNVEELAQYAFDQLIPMATDKGLKYTYKPPAKKLPQIMADKEKLRQVMNNLIDNALKYTKAGSVDVQMLQKGGDIVFQVKDSGKGVTPEEAESIFQKFSRGKESVKQSAGLGLGLYVAKIIIEQHKGRIWAESAGSGKGSIFSFSIPINNGLKETTLVDFAEQK